MKMRITRNIIMEEETNDDDDYYYYYNDLPILDSLV
jgi:hypothetical protein